MQFRNGTLFHFQQSIDYIEANLTEIIQLEAVAEVGLMSLSAYYVLFRKITGSTLKDYIFKRRMTLAGWELVFTEASILELAIKYQYSGYEPFSRAFRKFMGVSPSVFRRRGEYAESFPQLRFVEVGADKGQGGTGMIQQEMNRERLVTEIEGIKSGYVLDVDIDHFESVNVKFGRAAGDRVLQEVPIRIKRILDGEIEVTRYANDEFIIVLSEVTAREAEKLSEDILKAFEEPIEFDGTLIGITVSIGITQVKGGDKALEDANSSMLRAKENGRDQYYNDSY